MPNRGILARICGESKHSTGRVELIVANLQALLNTRLGNAVTAPIQAMENCTLRTIAEYEPRLENVTVPWVQTNDPLILTFEISGRLAGSWFARTHDLRSWVVRCDANLRKPALTPMPNLECYADSYRAMQESRLFWIDVPSSATWVAMTQHTTTQSVVDAKVDGGLMSETDNWLGQQTAISVDQRTFDWQNDTTPIRVTSPAEVADGADERGGMREVYHHGHLDPAPQPQTIRKLMHQVQALAAEHILLIERCPAFDNLRVIDPGGKLSLAICVSERGVELIIEGANLLLRSSGEIALDAEVIRMRGRDRVEIEGGRALTLRAEEQRLEATRGNVDIEASDDVALDGERVLLNCPYP